MAEVITAEQVASKIAECEPSRSVAERVMAVIDRDDIGAAELATVIGTDPALVERVMRTANSVVFSSQANVRTLQHAVAVIGFETVRSLALASFVDGVVAVSRQDWARSVTAAVGAAHVARRLGVDAQLAFSTGLLHDLGHALLESLDPSYVMDLDPYRTAPLTADSEARLLRAERRRYGLHHAIITGDVLAFWNFAPDVVEAVAHHHTPKGALSRLHAAIVDGYRLAHWLVLGIPLAEYAAVPGVLLPSYVPAEDLETLGLEVERRADDLLGDLFGVSLRGASAR
jgi:HD-like signal output (HDOD) protein